MSPIAQARLPVRQTLLPIWDCVGVSTVVLTCMSWLCSWDHNWVTHLDSAFQAAGPLTDNNVHMARGVRRIAITDTMKDVEPGFIGEPSTCEPRACLLLVH